MAIETLNCGRCRHNFTRERARGKKPVYCPSCRTAQRSEDRARQRKGTLLDDGHVIDPNVDGWAARREAGYGYGLAGSVLTGRDVAESFATFGEAGMVSDTWSRRAPNPEAEAARFRALACDAESADEVEAWLSDPAVAAALRDLPTTA